MLVYRSSNGGHYPAYVKSLQTLVEEYLPIDRDEYHVYKIRQAFRDVSLLYCIVGLFLLIVLIR